MNDSFIIVIVMKTLKLKSGSKHNKKILNIYFMQLKLKETLQSMGDINGPRKFTSLCIFLIVYSFNLKSPFSF